MSEFDLDRFLQAQAATYAAARAELASGQKRTHWMWFIFPQLAGLGSSPTSQLYAISGLREAQAYLLHPLLGSRLRDCTLLVTGIQGRTLRQIFGTPDDLKFHSSVTLFARAAPQDAVFRIALERFFAGEPDIRTLELLRAGQDAADVLKG